MLRYPEFLCLDIKFDSISGLQIGESPFSLLRNLNIRKPGNYCSILLYTSVPDLTYIILAIFVTVVTKELLIWLCVRTHLSHIQYDEDYSENSGNFAKVENEPSDLTPSFYHPILTTLSPLFKISIFHFSMMGIALKIMPIFSG